MNGPQHYAEAQRILNEDVPEAVAIVQRIIERGDVAAMTAAGQFASSVIAKAQVHATLAAAAASALPASQAYYGDESDATREWAMLLEASGS